MSDLTTNLALTLEISPDQILTYKPYDAGYTVILTDYRKFTGVQPAEPKPEPAREPGPYAGYYPDALPEKLLDVYNTPEVYTKIHLVELAQALQISRATRLTKAQLLEEIQTWKDRRELNTEATAHHAISPNLTTDKGWSSLKQAGNRRQ